MHRLRAPRIRQGPHRDKDHVCALQGVFQRLLALAGSLLHGNTRYLGVGAQQGCTNTAFQAHADKKMFYDSTGCEPI